MDNKSITPDKSKKKLVQARLPFKLLPSTEKNELILNSTENQKSKELKLDVESKDNLKETTTEKQNIDADVVIALSDEDEVMITDDNLKSNRTLNLDNKIKTPDNKSGKVFIKLPISSKKKKRKSHSLNEGNQDEGNTLKGIEDEKSLEIECNPNKKVKISDFVVKQKFKNGTSIINDITSLIKKDNLEVEEIKSDLACDKFENESVQIIMEVTEEENDTGLSKTNETISKSADKIYSKDDSHKNVNSTKMVTRRKGLLSAIETSSKSTDKITLDNSPKVINDSEKILTRQNVLSRSCNNKTVPEPLELMNKKIVEEGNLEESIIELDAVDADISDVSNITTELETSSCSQSNKTKSNETNYDGKTPRTPRSSNDTRKERLRLEKVSREQKRLQEKVEREEKRRKEKEEREKKRLTEIEARNEDKRLKEEERRKREEMKEEERRKREEMKEEDRKKKEEEKRKREEIKEEERKKKEEEKKKKEFEKEEMENKKKKAAEVFTKFFVQSRNSKVQEEENILTDKIGETFMPFQIKDDMRLAPLKRRILDSEQKNNVDKFLKTEQVIPHCDLYIKRLKNDNYKPLKGDRTILKTENEDDIIIVDEMDGTTQCIDESSNISKKYKAKFLWFCENRRPPYYGTWRKKSSVIKARQPFKTDKNIFDYEVDSDLEWEEEEPGESLNGSEDEKESEDDYEVDNEFFVPHGHLSDEELAEEDHTPEAQKVKLKILQQEFATEMKKKTEKIKPRLIGVVWCNKNSSKPDTCPTVVWELLKRQTMMFNDKISILIPKETVTENNSPNQQEKPKLNKRLDFPEEFTYSLIKLVHGNTNKKLFIVKEFQAYLERSFENNEKFQFTKSCIREKMESMAQWKLMQNFALKKKLCWTVKKEILEKYNLADLDIQNEWKYIMRPTNRRSIPDNEEVVTPAKIIKPNENSPAITKFTKILTKEEKEKLLEKNIINLKQPVDNVISTLNELNDSETNIKQNNKTNLTTTLTTATTTKKRVPILFSVPRGQNVPETSKNIAVNNFLKKSTTLISSNKTKTNELDEKDDCLVIE